MIKTQIQLHPAQRRRLQEIARRRRISMAETIRQSVDLALAQDDRAQLWERAWVSPPFAPGETPLSPFSTSSGSRRIYTSAASWRSPAPANAGSASPIGRASS